MIRRARLSLKPNFKPGGRGPGPSPGTAAASVGNATEPNRASQSSPGPNHDIPDTDNGVGVPNVPETRKAISVPEPADRGDSVLEKEKGTGPCNYAPPTEVQPCSASTPLQRRKRIATLPNLAKPRVSIPSAVTTLPQKASQGEVPVAVPSIGVAEATPEKAKFENFLKIPTPPGISQPSLPEKRTPVPQVPHFTPFKKPALKQPEISPVKAVEHQPKDDLCPLKERPSQGSCMIEEFPKRAKPSPGKKIGGNLEKERLKRARTLRDLLREELRKERRSSKEKNSSSDLRDEIDHSKMTMRDFIRYVPENNPMTSSLFDKDTCEKSSTAESQSAGPEKKTIVYEDEDLDEEEDEGPLLVPRVKVAEDGSIILDEESLTVEVSRTKGPIVENDDPIFERGSMTTYSSFRKTKHSKPWSDKETDMFFLAISMVGTDFSMITQLFPHRERFEIKNKFKREERMNGWRIDKAFREKKEFDLECFAKLLEEALMQEAKKPKTPKPRKAKGEQGNKTRKPRKKRKDEASEEQDSNLGEEEVEAAEKENEESQAENVPTSLSGKKKRARKKKDDAQSGEPEDLSEDLNKKVPAKEGKSRKKKKGEAVDFSADPETVDSMEMETAEGGESVQGESIQEKKKKRRRKKKPITEDSDTECHSDSELLHIAGDMDSGTKESSVILNDSVECCDQSVQESTEGNVGAAPVESLSVDDDDDDGTLEPFEDDDDGGDDEMLSIQEDTLVSNEQDSVMMLASDISLFDHSALSVAETQTETSPVESLQEATDPQTTISTTEKSQACDNQGVSGARTQEPCTTQDGFIQCSNIPSSLGKGRFQRPKPNLPKSCSRRGKQEKEGDMPDGKIEATAEDTTKTFQSPEDGKIPVSTYKNTPHNEDSVEKDESAKKSQVSSTSLLGPTQTPIKPAPVVRFRRAKPNLTKASARSEKLEERSDIQVEGIKASTEETAEIDQGPEGGMSSPTNISMDFPIISQEEKSSEEQENSCDQMQESSASQDTNLQSSLRPWGKSRFQKPKPNLAKSCARIEKQEEKEDIQEARIDAATERTTVHQSLEEDMSATKNVERAVCIQEDSPSALFHSASMDNSSQKPSEQSLIKEQHKGTEGKYAEIVAMHGSASQEACTPSSAMSSPSLRGRLHRPKPNLLSLSARKGQKEVKADTQSSKAASKDTVKTIEEPSAIGKPEDYALDVLTEESSTAGVVSAVSCSSPSSCPEKLNPTPTIKAEADGNQRNMEPDEPVKNSEFNNSQQIRKQEPLKPAVLTRGRFQKPKPNIGRAAGTAKKEAQELSSDGNGTAASDRSMEIAETDLPTVTEAEMMVMPELPENRSVLVEDSEASQLGSEDVQNNVKPDLKQEDMPQQQSVNANNKSSPSLQPSTLRGRFQRPTPNLLRAIAKKASSPVIKPARDEKTGDSKTDSGTEAKSRDWDSSEQLSVEEHQSISVSPVGSSRNGAGDQDISPCALPEAPASFSTEHDSSPAIKPAPLRRGRTLRLKPNLVNVPYMKESPGGDQTKAASSKLNAGGVTECVPLKNASHVTDVLGKPPTHKRKAADKSNIELPPKKIRSSEKAEAQSRLSERESECGSLDIEGQENTTVTRTRFGRKVKNSVPERTPVQPKGPENLSDLEKDKNAQNMKSNGNKIKVVKPISRKGTALVKLRASRWEEQDDDDEELYFKDESFNLSPDKVNQAPVFVPFSLRSLKHGPAEIEETVEELEIPLYVLDSHTIPETQNNDPVSGERQNSNSLLMSDQLSHYATDSEAVRYDEGTKCGHDCSDGSTEAAMALISMGNPVFQSRIHEESPSFQEDVCCSGETQSDLQHLDHIGSQSLFSEMDTIHAGFPSGEILEAHATKAEVVDPHLHTFKENNGDPSKMQPAAESLDGSVGTTESDFILLECFDSQTPDSEDVLQNTIVPDGENMSGVNECPAEEATFILTLVEIPINPECSYSCDPIISGEPLPAPMRISPSSSQPLTLTQSNSSESAEVSVPLSSVQSSTSGEESNSSWSSSSAPRKRTASNQDDESHPVKKALLICDKPEVSSDDSETEALNSPEISIPYTQEISPPEVMCDIVTEPSQDSQLSEDALSGMETLPEETTDSESLDSLTAIEARDAKSEQDGFSDALHFSSTNTPSTSEPLKRPGRMPLGFLSLVCKSKTKANEPSNMENSVLEPNVCTKPSSAEVQSQDVSVSEVSDSQTVTPEAPSDNEVASEEEETTVSQYFFSDIFMPVDDE
ncbi:transcription factor TFIIIB component B'' homolog isoform X2 [Xenopus laevis]|uniref:Transcription factor TFIIIB component B'' homolog isoform X2 n=1 Tax=Xenopus laevis TaxID=8355 RepID=A0A8J0U9M0_XENLA|nr:transcription factor TFIIIB component B'' homolog isoform X2 [Xenopus laevis]